MNATGTIPLTGKVRDAAGNLFNGAIRLMLSYSASHHITLDDLVVAAEVNFPIQNGGLPANARLIPNDMLTPANTTYTAQYLNPGGKIVGQNVFYVSGNAFDIGTALPTPLTTSNISFAVEELQGPPGPPGPMGPPFPLTPGTAVYADTLYLIKDPGAAVGDSRAISMRIVDDQIRHASRIPGNNASEKIANASADLPSTGGIIDASGLEGAQTWSSNPLLGVTKPITLIMGSGTTTIPVTMTLPNNVEVMMPAGAIFSVSSTFTLTLRISSGSALTQHFSGAGSVRLSNVSMIHTRWFDDGSHNELAIQQAINALGDDTPISRSGTVIWVDDVLSLRDTVILERKACTVDCGGIATLSSSNPSPNGGFLWDGPAGQPMVEVKNTMGGLTIQNSRFYGNPSAKPRSAISVIQQTDPVGQGSLIFRNLHIGMMFGDTDYTYTSLINGIYIGDTYDSGISSTNDHILIDTCRIWDVVEAGIRQGAHQNSLGTWRNINFIFGQYAFRVTSQVTIQNCFAAQMTGAVIYVPELDDYGITVTPNIYALNIQSENCARHLLMDGAAFFHQIGGGFASSASMAADLKIVKAENGNAQTVYLDGFSLQDLGGGGSMKIALKSVSVFESSQKQFRFSGPNHPILDMDSNSGFDVRSVQTALTFLDSAAISARTSSDFLHSANVITGQAAGDFGTFNAAKFHIPTRGLRIGDTNNRAGAWEISVASATLFATSGASVTAAGLIPANVMALGVATRNIDAQQITGGILRVGSAANATKWNANLALADHTATTMANWDVAVIAPYRTTAPEDVVVSVSGGTMTQVWIDVTAFFIKLLAPPGKF